MTIVKPFLKWAGGKTQIIDEVMKKFPTTIKNYREPFVGGGSVLLATLSYIRDNKINIEGKICAYDLNTTLINLYINVRDNLDELFTYVDKYLDTYSSLNGNEKNTKTNTEEEGLKSKENYYYWLRTVFNRLPKDSIERSALFMVINKTCFRGLYREGPNGFNVPYGNYKKVIIEKEDVRIVSNLIQNVEFYNMDYRGSFDTFEHGDFVYLDPPYAPENSKSFVKYNKDGFTVNDNIELFNKMKNSNIKFLMSNSDVDLVNDNFEGYENSKIECRRAINSKNPEAKTFEVLINN